MTIKRFLYISIFCILLTPFSAYTHEIVSSGSGITSAPAAAGAGGGDVTKVGTPVNNQIGVWTGDGTIEGDADLTYDGTTLGLGAKKITGVADPTLDQDAATKIYVDTATASFDVDYFFNNTASDVGGIYFDMTSAALGGGESTLSTAGLTASTNDQALVNFLTDETGGLGILDIPAGTFEAHFHAERTAGNSDVNIYAEIYKRASGGAETLIVTSQVSGLVTSKSDFSLFAHTTTDTDLLATDRILVKFLANLGSGSGATVAIYAEGTTVARLAFPTTSEILNQIFLRQDGTKPLTGAWEIQDDIDINFGNDADWSFQYNEAVDDQLIIETTNTAATATTDPLMQILVGTTPTADQRVFGIGKGTQASHTSLLWLDEDGDMTILGIFTATSVQIGSGTPDIQVTTNGSGVYTESVINQTNNESWITDMETTVNKRSVTSGTGITILDLNAIDVATTGKNTGGVVIKSTAANYTVGTTDSREAYGGVIYVTAAATITMPAVADGMYFTIIEIGTGTVSVDTNASDRMILDGIALDDGDKATSPSTTGSILVCIYESVAGWFCGSGSNDGTLWTDGGP